MDTSTLYLVMPAYNEEDTIESVVSQWYPIVERFGSPQSRMLVIDDGSRDRTGAILSRLARSRPQLIAISRPNRGHGATVYELYRRALEAGADYIFQTDSDGQTLPQEFSAFWENRRQYDALIGWRKGRQDGISRRVVTRVLRLTIFLTLGAWVKDANTPYRLMSAPSLSAMLEKIPAFDPLANASLAAAYVRFGQRVRFSPVTFLPRQGGVNSIRIPKICRIGYAALTSWLALGKEWRRCV